VRPAETMKTATPTRRFPTSVLRGGLAAAAISAALLVPVAPAGAQGGNQLKAYEERYLEVRKDYVAEHGRQAAGRNIVRHGFQEDDGDVRRARKPEVKRSTERMAGALPGVVAEAEAAASTPAEKPADGDLDTSGAPTSVIECESGGDYGAVNPAGYYGAYQFDQQTWDAYAPSGYAGTNPAQAPPAVQDAAAASVDYDAWPNC
jgi:hypothetical protein